MPHDLQIGLLRLLGVRTLDEFLENIWERRTRITQGAIKDSLAEILTQEQFEFLSAGVTAGTESGLNIVEGHVARPLTHNGRDSSRLEAVFDAYRRGCTLLLSGLQTRWPPITTICRAIENELISHSIPLAEAVSANAYLTPANSQGFGIHYDNHCALILQLHGRKRWTVFRPMEELPVTRCEQIMPRDQLGTPVLETDLVAGDVLYIPRGFPHFAASADTSSLHLTLSLRTMIWLEVIEALCRADAAFRQSVRPSSPGALTAQEHFQLELIPKFVGMRVADFLRDLLLECLAGLSPLPNGRFRAIDETASVACDTPVFRAPLVTCVSSEEDGQAVLRFPGGTLRLPAVMKPVFDFVAQNRQFTARELPPVGATYDAEEFTRILIRKGLVCPRETHKARVEPSSCGWRKGNL